MIIVYYVSVTTVGTWVTDWTNDGLFGDGFHLFGMSGDYDDETDKWANEFVFTDGVKAVVDEAAADSDIKGADELQGAIEDGDFGAFEEAYGSYVDEFYKNEETGGKVYDIDAALGEALDEEGEFTAPDPADYGTWVPVFPCLLKRVWTLSTAATGSRALSLTVS